MSTKYMYYVVRQGTKIVKPLWKKKRHIWSQDVVSALSQDVRLTVSDKYKTINSIVADSDWLLVMSQVPEARHLGC